MKEDEAGQVPQKREQMMGKANEGEKRTHGRKNTRLTNTRRGEEGVAATTRRAGSWDR